ncbi:MAG: amidase [Anaerolineales bacterium]|nr:amidase [Anaerolineales bacterium]
MSDLTTLSAIEIAQQIQTGQISACDAVEAHIARIETTHGKINAIVMPRFEEARREAREADAARARGDKLGPLHGVPVTIKDQFHVRGLPTTYGVARLKGNVAAADGAMVAAFRQAGAIILGKTNVPQTLGVIETDNTLFGRTNNPWNLARTAGGSSGGEAANIAVGGAPLGLGGDFGGSIRVPAAYCGIYGLKPTARRLPSDPLPIKSAIGAEGIVAQPGPMARNVADLTLAFQVMVNHNLAHPTGFTPPVPFADPQHISIRGLRVALIPQIGDWVPSPAIRRALQEAADALRQQGAVVEPWPQTPDPAEAMRLFFNIVSADGFAMVSQLLNGEAPIPLMAPNVRITKMPNAMIPVISALLARGNEGRLSRMLKNARKQSAEGLFNLMGKRLEYESRFLGAMAAGQFNALLCPLSPLPPVRHGDTNNLADFWGTATMFNVLGFPAGVAPITRVRPGEETERPDSREKSEQVARAVEQGSTGLPIAVQVAAPHWREDVVLAVMGALEAHFRLFPDYPAWPTLE